MRFFMHHYLLCAMYTWNALVFSFFNIMRFETIISIYVCSCYFFVFSIHFLHCWNINIYQLIYFVPVFVMFSVSVSKINIVDWLLHQLWVRPFPFYYRSYTISIILKCWRNLDWDRCRCFSTNSHILPWFVFSL